MVYRATLPAVLAAALAFGTVPALAATTNETTKPDVTDFQRAKITLDQAIAAAQKESGGNAIDANFLKMNGKTGYAVSVLADNQIKGLWVDPQSGQATPETRLTTAELNQQSLDKADLSGVHNEKATLAQAIAMAEQHSGGKAIDAGVAMHNDSVAYNVQTVLNGKLSTTWVNPATGQIIS